MIDSLGWLDWAERVPGFPAKTNAGINAAKGIFLHSAEGYEAYLRTDPPRPVGVSWHLSNLLNGHLLQHYPLTARCWHATAANNSYLGMEHEGVWTREPTLTAAQIATARRVIAEVSAWKGWTPTRPTSPTDTSHTLWEHNEVVRLGGSATACPSGRIPWDKILAPEPQEEEFIMPNPVWATWKEPPPGTTYRSYLLFASPSGLRKDFVESAAQEDAFRHAGIITRKTPLGMSLEDLKAFAGSPEPDE